MEWEQEIPLYYDDMVLPLILYTPEAKDQALAAAISNISFTAPSNDAIVSGVNTEIGESKKLSEPTKGKYLICLSCGYEAATSKGLKLHKKKHRNKSFHPCQYCHFTFRKSKDLIRHTSQFHSDEKRYMCPHCDYGSRLQKSLKMHIYKKHKEVRDYQSNDCAHNADTSEKLQRHHEMHSTDVRIPSRCCIFCSFVTENLRDLKHHIKVTHKNIKEYTCKDCDFKSVILRRLQKHLASEHNEEEFYKCPYCQYTATCTENLNRHLLMKHNISSNTTVSFTHAISEESQSKVRSRGIKQFPVVSEVLPIVNTKETILKRANIKDIKKDNKSKVKRSVGIKISTSNLNGQMRAEPVITSYNLESVSLGSNTEPLAMSGSKENANTAQSEVTEAQDGILMDNMKSNDRNWVDSKAVYPEYYFSPVSKHALTYNIKMIKRNNCYECISCDFSTAYVKAFARHVAEKHRDGEVCHCPICSYSTDNLYIIQKHILKHFSLIYKQNRREITDRLKASSNLPERFGSQVKKDLAHSEDKHVKEMLHCQICSFSTTSGTRLEWHSEVHIKSSGPSKEEKETCIRKIKPKQKNIIPIQCSVCKFVASGHRELKNHVKTIHENFPEYKCPLCDFRTVYKVSINIHIMGQHMKERPYSCNKCSFTSVQRCNLKHHIRNKHPKRHRLL